MSPGTGRTWRTNDVGENGTGSGWIQWKIRYRSGDNQSERRRSGRQNFWENQDRTHSSASCRWSSPRGLSESSKVSRASQLEEATSKATAKGCVWPTFYKTGYQSLHNKNDSRVTGDRLMSANENGKSSFAHEKVEIIRSTDEIERGSVLRSSLREAQQEKTNLCPEITKVIRTSEGKYPLVDKHNDGDPPFSWDTTRCWNNTEQARSSPGSGWGTRGRLTYSPCQCNTR